MEEIRVLIMTPMAVEYQAVAKYLANPKRFVHEKAPHAAYTVGEFVGKHHKYQVIIREPGQLPIEMALATQEAIQHFHPQIAMLIGVAGGIKDVTIGDVLIANKVYSYEGGKEDKDGFNARPVMGGGSKELLAYAQIMSKSDMWKIRTHDGAPRSRMIFGAIASGSKVVASKNNPTYQNIKKHFNDSLGVEMEAYGFISALNGVHGLVIRGISDLCEGKEEASDERWQPVAVERAAAVVFEMLNEMDCSLFITPVMDAKTIAREIYDLLFPRPESIKEIENDFANATKNEVREIWRRVKPLFIKEVEELAKAPNDADVQADVRNRLKRELTRKEGLQRELVELLMKSQKQHNQQAPEAIAPLSTHTISISIGNVRGGSSINNAEEIKQYYGSQKKKRRKV